MDLYLLATPLFAIFIALNLIALKLSLRANQPKQRLIPQTISVQALKVNLILCFLLKNCTIGELILVRKAKNKIPMLFTFSILAILSFSFPTIFFFTIIGSIVSVCFFGLQMGLMEENQGQGQVKQQKSSKVAAIYISIISTSSIILLVLCTVLLYKNYKNKALQTFLLTFLTNLCLDFLIAQPLICVLISYPISKFQKVHKYIAINKQIEAITTGSNQVVPDLELGVGSPKKQRLSPSKIPKTFLNLANDNLFEIQPHSIEQTTKEELFKNNLSYNIQITKKNKKERQLLPPISNSITPTNRRLNNGIQEEGQLYGVNNSSDKLNFITPIAQIKLESRIIDEDSIVNKFQKDQQFTIINVKKKSINELKEQEQMINQQNYQDRIDFINQLNLHSQTQPTIQNPKVIQNQSDRSVISKQDQQRQQRCLQDKVNEDEQNRESDDQNRESEQSDIQQVVILPHRKDSGGSQAKMINLLSPFQNNIDYSEEDCQDNSQHTYNSHRRQSIDNQKTISINGCKKNSLLQIREDLNDEIEEIDTNSPQKRRRPIKKGEQARDQPVKRKRNMRKYSTKKRVIKFTSGQPYLEYLPHMLSKEIQENRHKKSQPTIQKEDTFFGEKKRKSVRKLKNTKDPVCREEPNQNDCPEFCIQNL